VGRASPRGLPVCGRSRSRGSDQWNLLLDENLSPRLTPRLGPLFPKLTHVREVGLKQASDEAIWEWAKQNGYTIVTTDSDFVALSAGGG
jgi:predicted nuclease of predicted toxin-antitoxin system